MSLASPHIRAHSLSFVAASFVVSLGLLAVGCFNPQIGDKTLKCNGMYMAGGGDCPDGFHCEGDGLCHKGAFVPSGSAGAGGRAGGGTGGGGAGGVGGGGGTTSGQAGSDGGMPDVPQSCINTPVMGCTADTAGKKCDPVCQVGCGCHEKCSANTAGLLTCNVPLALRAKALGEGCNPSSVGLAAQTDDCMPGLVCLQDACGPRCYHFCKSDADCPLSTCTRDTGGVKVCDVQQSACNPVRGMATGCPADAQACFVLPNGLDQTLCDCPGAGPLNSVCTFSRDCFPGLVCVDTGGTGTATCRPTCSLAPTASDCGAGTCNPIKGSKKYGYCSN